MIKYESGTVRYLSIICFCEKISECILVVTFSALMCNFLANSNLSVIPLYTHKEMHRELSYGISSIIPRVDVA